MNDVGEWIAGYCINQEANFRYLEFLNDYSKKVMLRDKGLVEDELVEITCIWMNREVLKNEQVRLMVYFTSLEDALETNQPVIIGGSKIMAVWKNFEIPLPYELYFGLVPFSEKYEMAKIVYAKAEEVYQFVGEQFAYT